MNTIEITAISPRRWSWSATRGSFRLSDQKASERITIRQLLAQTSGIPDSMDLTDHFESDRVPPDVLPDLAERELENEPGEEHIYSSVNYLVLAAVVEAVTDRPFADVLTARVLEPAGMDDAITTQEQAGADLPAGHRFVFGRRAAFTSPYDPAGTGYGYLGGTLEDAAAFVQANLGDSDTLLNRERRELMYRGEVKTDEHRTYGFGWRRWLMEDTESRMVWHSGASPGYFASMILLPEKNRGIVVLQNAYGGFQENAASSVGFGVAQLIYGEEPDTAGADPLYWAILAVFGVTCVLLLAFFVRSVGRLGRTSAEPSNRRPWRLVLGAAAELVALLLVLRLALTARSAWEARAHRSAVLASGQ